VTRQKPDCKEYNYFPWDKKRVKLTQEQILSLFQQIPESCFQRHEKDVKLLILFEGFVPRQGFGRNIEVLYKESFEIQVFEHSVASPDTLKDARFVCGEPNSYNKKWGFDQVFLPMDRYLIATPFSSKFLFHNYNPRNFSYQWQFIQSRNVGTAQNPHNETDTFAINN
jgi:hypothetical protein